MNKLLCLLSIPFLALSVLGCNIQEMSEFISSVNSPEVNEDSLFLESRKLVFQTELKKAETFLMQNKSYNQNTVILIDMRIPSGTFRFFCVDTKTDSIFEKGLVAHGSGSVYSDDSLIFSNIPNSYKTSLGKYKIGGSYQGNFGKSYKLHGLDATNNKAYDRYVVLHPYSCVPDEEQDYPICESLGCPMVSNAFMNTLYGIIDKSTQPILMVIYY